MATIVQKKTVRGEMHRRKMGENVADWGDSNHSDRAW